MSHAPIDFVTYALTRGYGYEYYLDKDTNEIHILRPSKAEDCSDLTGPLSFGDITRAALAKVQS